MFYLSKKVLLLSIGWMNHMYCTYKLDVIVTPNKWIKKLYGHKKDDQSNPTQVLFYWKPLNVKQNICNHMLTKNGLSSTLSNHIRLVQNYNNLSFAFNCPVIISS